MILFFFSSTIWTFCLTNEIQKFGNFMKTPDQNRKINIQNTTQTLQPNKDILKNKNASDIADIIQI